MYGSLYAHTYMYILYTTSHVIFLEWVSKLILGMHMNLQCTCTWSETHNTLCYEFLTWCMYMYMYSGSCILNIHMYILYNHAMACWLKSFKYSRSVHVCMYNWTCPNITSTQHPYIPHLMYLMYIINDKHVWSFPHKNVQSLYNVWGHILLLFSSPIFTPGV